jgi:putative peptidoglycan lipid II flippase
LRRILTAALRSVLYLTLPAIVGLIWLRGPLVSSLFERGAFDAQSTQATAWALTFYALGLVGHSVVEVVTRAFYALHDTRTPVVVGVAAMVVNIALSLALIAGFGALGWMPHGGLALANSLATLGEMVVLLVLIGKPLAGLEVRRLSGALGRMGLACLAMAGGLAGVTALLASAPAWLVSVASVILGGGIYGLVTLLLGSEEPAALLRGLRRRWIR